MEEHETADGRISVAVIERCACEANDSQKCSSKNSVESYTNSTRCGKHNLAESAFMCALWATKIFKYSVHVRTIPLLYEYVGSFGINVF